MGSPSALTRALAREAWISMRATRPWTSGSLGTRLARMRPRRRASSQRVGRSQSSPAVAGGGAGGDFEGDAGCGEGAFGADDALGDGGFGEEEGAGDLVGGEAAEHAEGEGKLGFGREDGVARDEDEAEEVVADVVVDCGD